MVSPVGFGRPTPLMQVAGTPPAASGAPAGAGGPPPAAAPAAPAGAAPAAAKVPVSVARAFQMVQNLWVARIRTDMEGPAKARAVDERYEQWFYPKLGAELAKGYVRKPTDSLAYKNALAALGKAQTASQLRIAFDTVNAAASTPMSGDDIVKAAKALDSKLLEESIKICLGNIRDVVDYKKAVDIDYYEEAFEKMLTSDFRQGLTPKAVTMARMAALQSIDAKVKTGKTPADAVAEVAASMAKEPRFQISNAVSAAAGSGAAAAAAGGLAGYPPKAVELARELVRLKAEIDGEDVKKLTDAQIIERAQKLLDADYKDYTDHLPTLIKAIEGDLAIYRRKRIEKMGADVDGLKDDVKGLKAGDGKLIKAKGKVGFGNVWVGDFSTPTGALHFETEGKTGPWNGLSLFGKAEIDAAGAFKTGEGSPDDTQLFGPGPKSKLNRGFMFSNAATGVRHDSSIGTLRLSYGLIESSYYHDIEDYGPLGLILGGIKYHGVSNVQRGFQLFGETLTLSKRLQLSGGLTYGDAVDDLRLFGGDFGYVLHEDGDQKGQPVKQMDGGLSARITLGDGKSVAAHYHYVRSFNSRESASHALSFGTRWLLSPEWEFGGDLHLNPVLAPSAGQKGVSSYGVALQLNRVIERNKEGVPTQSVIVSGGWSNRSVTRSVLEERPGTPSNLPEQQSLPIETLSGSKLCEFGLTYFYKGFSARAAYVCVPESQGVMSALSYAF